MKRYSIALGFFIFLLLMCANFALGEEAASFENPREIERLDYRDLTFRDYSEDVRKARRALASGVDEAIAERTRFYRYTAQEGDDLLGIAARCSVSYESIATLNRIAHMDDGIAGKTLLLPSMPGIYVPPAPKNPFEELIAAEFADGAGEALPVGGGAFRLFAGKSLSMTARAFFLVRTLRFPLPEAILTSPFGDRINPVTGNRVFHRGIDLAAPMGTPVYTCAPGVVIESSYSNIYGNYIIIRHSGGRESLYGHLSKKNIELHDRVNSDTIIGHVGSTGQSTGPHLHFEIHENGVPRDPQGLLR